MYFPPDLASFVDVLLARHAIVSRLRDEPKERLCRRLGVTGRGTLFLSFSSILICVRFSFLASEGGLSVGLADLRL